MANFVYNEIKRAVIEGEIDLGTGGDTIKVRLVMTNTTCDTEDDVNTLDGFTTIDVYDGSSYADQTIANQVVNEDSANDRAEMDGDNVTFSTLGVGTRQCQGALIYKFVTNDTDSVPIAFIDTGGFPFDGSGADVTIQWNAEGILQQA